MQKPFHKKNYFGTNLSQTYNKFYHAYTKTRKENECKCWQLTSLICYAQKGGGQGLTPPLGVLAAKPRFVINQSSFFLINCSIFYFLPFWAVAFPINFFSCFYSSYINLTAPLGGFARRRLVSGDVSSNIFKPSIFFSNYRQKIKSSLTSNCKQLDNIQFITILFPFVLSFSLLIRSRYKEQFFSYFVNETLPGFCLPYQNISWETFNEITSKQRVSTQNFEQSLTPFFCDEHITDIETSHTSNIPFLPAPLLTPLKGGLRSKPKTTDTSLTPPLEVSGGLTKGMLGAGKDVSSDVKKVMLKGDVSNISMLEGDVDEETSFRTLISRDQQNDLPVPNRGLLDTKSGVGTKKILNNTSLDLIERLDIYSNLILLEMKPVWEEQQKQLYIGFLPKKKEIILKKLPLFSHSYKAKKGSETNFRFDALLTPPNIFDVKGELASQKAFSDFTNPLFFTQKQNVIHSKETNLLFVKGSGFAHQKKNNKLATFYPFKLYARKPSFLSFSKFKVSLKKKSIDQKFKLNNIFSKQYFQQKFVDLDELPLKLDQNYSIDCSCLHLTPLSEGSEAALAKTSLLKTLFNYNAKQNLVNSSNVKEVKETFSLFSYYGVRSGHPFRDVKEAMSAIKKQKKDQQFSENNLTSHSSSRDVLLSNKTLTNPDCPYTPDTPIGGVTKGVTLPAPLLSGSKPLDTAIGGVTKGVLGADREKVCYRFVSGFVGSTRSDVIDLILPFKSEVSSRLLSGYRFPDTERMQLNSLFIQNLYKNILFQKANLLITPGKNDVFVTPNITSSFGLHLNPLSGGSEAVLANPERMLGSDVFSLPSTKNLKIIIQVPSSFVYDFLNENNSFSANQINKITPLHPERMSGKGHLSDVSDHNILEKKNLLTNPQLNFHYLPASQTVLNKVLAEKSNIGGIYQKVFTTYKANQTTTSLLTGLTNQRVERLTSSTDTPFSPFLTSRTSNTPVFGEANPFRMLGKGNVSSDVKKDMSGRDVKRGFLTPLLAMSNKNTLFGAQSFRESWEPVTLQSWLAITKLSFAFFVLKFLQYFYTNYGRDLLIVVLRFLDENLKERLGLSNKKKNKGYRLIKKVKKAFKDVAGIDNILPELGEMVWVLRNSGKGLLGKTTFKFGNLLPKGFLFVGPPGTGKTFLVQAIAGEAGVPVLVQSGSSLTDAGENEKGAQRLKSLFEKARQLAPCIVFIDEIDTLGETRQNVMRTPDAQQGVDDLIQSLQKYDQSPNTTALHPDFAQGEGDVSSPRGQSGLQSFKLSTNKLGNKAEKFDKSNIKASENLQETQKNREKQKANQEQLTLLMQLLIELDGLKSRKGVIVIGATNRPKVLDPALTRPGRFDRVLNLELPGKKKRIEILKLYSQNIGLALPSASFSTSPSSAYGSVKMSNKDLSSFAETSVDSSNEDLKSMPASQDTSFFKILKSLPNKDYLTSPTNIEISHTFNIPFLPAPLVRSKTRKEKKGGLLRTRSKPLKGVLGAGKNVSTDVKKVSEATFFEQKPWEYLANRTFGFSAADLAAAMNQSSIQAILRKTGHTIETIEQGIEFITSYSIEKPKIESEKNQETFCCLTSDTSNTSVFLRKGLLPNSSDVNTLKGVLGAGTKEAVFEANIDAYKSNSFQSPMSDIGSTVNEKQKGDSKTTFLFDTFRESVRSTPSFVEQKDGKQKLAKENKTILQIPSLVINVKLPKALLSFLNTSLTSLPYILKGFASTADEPGGQEQDPKRKERGVRCRHKEKVMSFPFRVKVENKEKKDPFFITRFAYYQAGKAVLHTLLPEHPDAIILKLWPQPKNSRHKDANFQLTSIDHRAKLETRLIGLYAGKAAELLFLCLNSHIKKENLLLSLLDITDKNLTARKRKRASNTDISALTPFRVLEGGKGDVTEKGLLLTLSPKVSNKSGANTKKGMSKRMSKKIDFSLYEKRNFCHSNLGIDELSIASNLANSLVDKWFFYSNKTTLRKENQIFTNQNILEFSKIEVVNLFQQLTEEVQNLVSVSNISESSLLPLTSLMSKGAGRERHCRSNFQEWSIRPWWQNQIAKETGNLNMFYDDWYRIYLPDPEESERNEEWVVPDEYYHNTQNLKNLSPFVRASRKQRKKNTFSSNIAFGDLLLSDQKSCFFLQTHSQEKGKKQTNLVFKKDPTPNSLYVDITWNDLYKIDRDYIYQALILTCFNKAFSLLDDNRELLDYLADYLMRFETLRQHKIEEIFCDFGNITSNSLNDVRSNVTQVNLKQICNKPKVGCGAKDLSFSKNILKEKRKFVFDKKWGRNSRRNFSNFFNFDLLITPIVPEGYLANKFANSFSKKSYYRPFAFFEMINN